MFLTALASMIPLAYIGPGAGMGLIGALIALVVAIFGALFFVVLWPLRAMFRKNKAGEQPAAENPPATDGQPAAAKTDPEPAQPAWTQ